MYGICRIEKVKASGVSAMEKHNDRLWDCRNGDIDREKSHENVELLERSGGYVEAVESRIAEGYTGKRAVRKDAVRLVEGIVTASPEFFEGKSRAEIMAFFQDALSFAESEFEHENMVHFTVHFDETTPHAHFGFVPLTADGRLSAKAWFNGRDALRSFQDRFFEKVAEPWGLERGEPVEETERHHKSVVEMKCDEIADLRATCEQLQNEVEALTQERDEARSEAMAAKKEIIELHEEVASLRGALQRLKEGFAELVSQLVEVAETLKHRRFIGTWKHSLEKLRDNPIAVKAVEAGMPWRCECDAKRADKAIKREVEAAGAELERFKMEAVEMSRDMEGRFVGRESPNNPSR